jgi:hypothetical protein
MEEYSEGRIRGSRPGTAGPSAVCPLCGAAFPAGGECRDRFDLLQQLELEHPAYGAVHHLSVPCYFLQHNAYSRRGWLEVRGLLAKFVREGWTPAMARRENRLRLDGRRRNWSIRRGPGLREADCPAWSVTVADVRGDTALAYTADVRRWAAAVLADSERTAFDWEEKNRTEPG